jgi:trigger factor
VTGEEVVLFPPTPSQEKFSTVQVTTEQIDPCKIALTISVEPEKVVAAKEKAFQQFARNIQLPGFRKGKVPPQMARTYVDPDRVKQRAAEMLVGPAYAEAVEETKVEPFGGIQPDVELVEMNDGGPLVFKAFVPLRPVVTLGPYKGLSLERRRLEVTDADVDRQIEEIRTRQAEYPQITDRNVERGDVILADVTAVIEGQETPENPDRRSTVIDVGRNIEDFDNGLAGMSVGETKTIEAMYPADFPDEKLRGKRATFTVTVNEVRAKILPELTDEFVQKVHPTAKTPEELRAAVRESLEQAAEEMADNDLEYRLVAQIVDSSQINFPDGLLRAEMQEDIRQFQERLKRDNITLEQYLENSGRTAQEIEGEMSAGADRRIRNSLVLSEVARTEEISANDADIDRVIAERAERARVSPAAVRAYAEKNDQMNSLRDQALTEKILAFLKEASHVTQRTVTGDELRAEAAAEEAAASPAEPAAPLAVEASARPKRRAKKAADTGDAGDAGDTGEAAEAAPSE